MHFFPSQECLLQCIHIIFLLFISELKNRIWNDCYLLSLLSNLRIIFTKPRIHLEAQFKWNWQISIQLSYSNANFLVPRYTKFLHSKSDNDLQFKSMEMSSTKFNLTYSQISVQRIVGSPSHLSHTISGVTDFSIVTQLICYPSQTWHGKTFPFNYK